MKCYTATTRDGGEPCVVRNGDGSDTVLPCKSGLLCDSAVYRTCRTPAK